MITVAAQSGATRSGDTSRFCASGRRLTPMVAFRCALGLTLAAGAYAGCLRLLLWGMHSKSAAVRAGGATLDDLITLAAAVLAIACLTWLALSVVIALLVTLPTLAASGCGRLATAVTPTVVRRLAVAVLGAASVVPLGTPVASAAEGRGDAAAVNWGSTGVLPGLDRPTEPAGAPPALADSSPSARVIVRSGDTLWGLAASRLPIGASPQAIARSWPQWYSANRTAIGDDPNLLHPGTVLTPP